MNYFPRSIDRGHAYRSLDIHTDTFLLDLELLLFTTFSSSEFQANLSKKSRLVTGRRRKVSRLRVGEEIAGFS